MTHVGDRWLSGRGETLRVPVRGWGWPSTVAAVSRPPLYRLACVCTMRCLEVQIFHT